MKIYNIKGNTYYFETKYSYIPFYKLNDNEIVMLDSGYYGTDDKIIQELISKYNFNVKAVICSHGHIDHIGNNFWLQEKYNTEIIMSDYESNFCESVYGLKSFHFTVYLKGADKRFEPIPFKTDRKITNSDKYIEISGNRFEIVQLPGHTYFHLGIITPDNVFYVGDSLLSSEAIKENKLSFSSNILLDINSKEKIRNTKCEKYILAHKGVYDYSLINEIIDQNLLFYEEQMQLIIDSVKNHMTFDEIFKEIIQKIQISKHALSYVQTERIIKNFINYLLENGVLRIEIEDDTLKYCRNKHIAIE